VFRPSTDRRSPDSIASPSVSKLRSLGTAILAQFEVVAFLSSCREAIEGATANAPSDALKGKPGEGHLSQGRCRGYDLRLRQPFRWEGRRPTIAF